MLIFIKQKCTVLFHAICDRASHLLGPGFISITPEKVVMMLFQINLSQPFIENSS